MRLALVLLTTALAALAVNFMGATGGHCGDDGCTGLPEWLYVSSGWMVTACLAGMLVLVGLSLTRRRR